MKLGNAIMSEQVFEVSTRDVIIAGVTLAVAVMPMLVSGLGNMFQGDPRFISANEVALREAQQTADIKALLYEMKAQQQSNFQKLSSRMQNFDNAFSNLANEVRRNTKDVEWLKRHNYRGGKLYTPENDPEYRSMEFDN